MANARKKAAALKKAEKEKTAGSLFSDRLLGVLQYRLLLLQRKHRQKPHN
ncbi:MAG: hypothetical protein ACI9D5_002317 [Candidatus Endobugula sp.]|jgi:hypothetical protein